MNAQVQRLVELQAVDARLAELRGRLEALPQQWAAVEAKVAAARRQLASAKEALTNSLKERKKYEMDAESWKEKARRYREQSFEVKTNEAYKALQHEAEHAQKELALAEDRLLERMVAGEEFERQVKAAERALAEAEQAAGSEQRELKARQAQWNEEAARAEGERQRMAQQIPEELLRTYESIARRRHGVALAEVREGSCSMCGMMARPHVVQELQRPDSAEIFQCESCTRILYWAERTAAGPAISTAAPAAGQSEEEAESEWSDPPGGEG